jgi:CheY-like chemotaxis protein
MEPFFTTKDEGKGTGLGLSMVYGFAKQSGGLVDIHSEVGVGTTVRLYFPCDRDEDRDAPGRTPLEILSSVEGGREFILVVDDRPEVAAMANQMLKQLGYAVRVAHSAKDALDALDALPEDGRPDLLFSDFIMPGGMNGLLLAREMQRRVPGIRVLLTTGYAGEAASRGADRGMDLPVLKKPYRMDDLARKVRAVLDGAPSPAGAPGP